MEGWKTLCLLQHGQHHAFTTAAITHLLLCSTRKWGHHLYPPHPWDYCNPKQLLMTFAVASSALQVPFLPVPSSQVDYFLQEASYSTPPPLSLHLQKNMVRLVVIIIIAAIIGISLWLSFFPSLLWLLFRRIRALRRRAFIRCLLFFWGFLSIYLSDYHGVYQYFLWIHHSCSNWGCCFVCGTLLVFCNSQRRGIAYH